MALVALVALMVAISISVDINIDLKSSSQQLAILVEPFSTQKANRLY